MIDTLAPNPTGSRGWSAGGAFAGRIVGGVGGQLAAMAIAPVPTPTQIELMKEARLCETDCDAVDRDAEPAFDAAKKWLAGIVIGEVLGGGAMAAVGAAIGAPKPLRSRAATGAAIGGAVPFFGGWLAPIGAWLATAPRQRSRNPMSPATTAIASVVGLAALGGLVYAGTRLVADRAQKT